VKDVVAISLFSGAGGLDLGAQMAGARVVSCVDFDDDSIATLKANRAFEDCDIHHADVSKFDTKLFKKRLATERGADVIVIGGPPCQPFSKNGYWVKNENRLAMKDPRNMIRQFFRVVKELEPDGFLLENVESILHPTNKEAIRYIERRASELGFSYKLVRTNAADFGVPQRRKRVFIFGTRGHINGAMPLRTHCSAEEREIFPELEIHKGVGAALKPFSKKKFFEKEEVAAHGTFYPDLIRVPAGKNYMALRREDGSDRPKYRPGGRFWNFLLKLHPDEPSWTIAANPGPWVGPFHWDNRRLRVPEIAAIQTFPEGYKFAGKRRSIQKQLGNAVPPLLAKNMISFLMEHL
jgi:DNA (cytosine-5)-methyltransferase 1